MELALFIENYNQYKVNQEKKMKSSCWYIMWKYLSNLKFLFRYMVNQIHL